MIKRIISGLIKLNHKQSIINNGPLESQRSPRRYCYYGQLLLLWTGSVTGHYNEVMLYISVHELGP